MAKWLAAASVAMMLGQAAPDWLPPPVQEGVAQQLAERLAHVEKEWSAERRANAAQMAVAVVRKRLDAVSGTELLKKAPALTLLQLPSAGSELLDAMVRYQMCNGADLFVYELRGKQEVRAETVMRLTAGTLIVLYLRNGFITEGGNEEQLERAITDEKFQPAIDRFINDRKVLAAVQAECAPVFKSLMAP